MKARKNSHSAFSLIEALVALAVFAMAVTVFTQSCYNALLGINSLSNTSEQESTVFFARKHLLQIKERSDVEKAGTLNTPEGEEIQWEAELSTTEVLDLFKVELRVTFENKDNTSDNTITQTFYALRSNWTDPVERSSLLQQKQSNRDATTQSASGLL